MKQIIAVFVVALGLLLQAGARAQGGGAPGGPINFHSDASSIFSQPDLTGYPAGWATYVDIPDDVPYSMDPDGNYVFGCYCDDNTGSTSYNYSGVILVVITNNSGFADDNSFNIGVGVNGLVSPVSGMIAASETSIIGKDLYDSVNHTNDPADYDDWYSPVFVSVPSIDNDSSYGVEIDVDGSAS